MAQLDARWTGDQEVVARLPPRLATFFHGDLQETFFCGHSLPLIQEGQ